METNAVLDLWLWSLLQPLKGIIGSLVIAGINIEEMLSDTNQLQGVLA